MARDAIAFGPFRLDPRAHQLFRDGAPVPLSAHLVDLLAYFATRPGELLTKDAIFAAVWPDVFVTDNTLARAVADLRRALGDDPARPRYIQTVARRGYRFVAEVSRQPAAAGGARAEGLDDLRAFVASVRDLERLRVDALEGIRARLEQAAPALAGYAPLHVALASAAAIAFEASRARPRPDKAALDRALTEARHALALDASLGEAWATLAFALTSAGEFEQARAAARQAVRLEPTSWRHHFRLALAAWGEERLRAAQRALALLPGFPYACFLGATVLVARGVLPEARAMVAEGLAGAAGEPAPDRLPPSGLHWLAGAIAAADPTTSDAALDAFDREVAAHDAGRLYSTEFAVNAWHWRAGLLARLGRTGQAIDALRAALALAPDHPRSLVALAALLARDPDTAGEAAAQARRADDTLAALEGQGRPVEAVLCLATRDVIAGEAPAALARLSRMLDEAPVDQAGWTLPIEPWLQHLRGHAPLEALLRRVAQRAA